MSKNISLFSGYDQKENRTTNYCLLVLKMLYEENPKFLSEVLSTLVDETIGSYVGVGFFQQQVKKTSIPDGLIRQLPFTIYIETKNYNWFTSDQLENHLASLIEIPGAKVLIALSKFESEDDQLFDSLEAIISEKEIQDIYFAAISFDDFLQAVKAPLLSKNLADAISDFGAYLNEQNLLSTWRNLLDVVNCAGFPHEVLEGQVYLCPAKGGAYNHSRCQYFGMYQKKKVEKIARIRAVIDVESEDSAFLKWKNVDAPTDDLIYEAVASHQKFRPRDYPTRVFLLDDLYSTDFKKETPGGMMGSKQYFDISSLGISDAACLAAALNGKTWSNYKA